MMHSKLLKDESPSSLVGFAQCHQGKLDYHTLDHLYISITHRALPPITLLPRRKRIHLLQFDTERRRKEAKTGKMQIRRCSSRRSSARTEQTFYTRAGISPDPFKPKKFSVFHVYYSTTKSRTKPVGWREF
jgi:hypothetical protein